MVKVRDNANKKTDEFLKEMADRAYGVNDRIERVTISMAGNLSDKLDDIVRTRKRAKQEHRTKSALIVEAIEYYLSNHKT